jgi:outer membrane protein assembly factor BamB
MIYGATNYYVFSIDENTGNEIWRTKLTAGFLAGGVFKLISILVKGDVVIAGSDGNMWGINKNTGEILWRNGLKGLGYENLSMATENVSIQYVQEEVKK